MVKGTTQFTSSPAKCSHLYSSRGTKNGTAGFRQWAAQAAIPFLPPVFKWSWFQPQVSLQKGCSILNTIWATSCQSHACPRNMHVQLRPLSPQELMPSLVGHAQVSQRCVWAWSQTISPACPKDQLKRGQWENSVPSLVLSFLLRQTRKPEKN